ncbi:hypothetical protein BMS3Bbin14_01904 [bacterium BMS3Bbin14]|nr:hypothetical protein BMS3Bbin14_01904 [bacterium BMS3Bbin14]
MKFFRLTALALLLAAFFPPAAAGAGSLAVFPLLDLTRDANGVNLPLTGYLRRQAGKLGNTLIPAKEIMAFMVRHRIRTLGRLDSQAIAAAGKELGADLILQGTVCQLDQTPSAAVALSLQLIRTSDGRTIWTTTKALSLDDLQNLLALSDPETMADLFKVYFPTLLASFPGKINPAGPAGVGLTLTSIVLRPEYVQPGRRVECRVIISATSRIKPGSKASIQVGDRVYPATLNEEEYGVTASWPAQRAAGTYQVTLVVKQPSGRRETVILGRYHVDNAPPSLVVHAVGKELDGLVTFSRSLAIITTMPDPELLDRWNVAVFNKDNETIVYQEAAGQVPERINWNGYTSGSIPAPDGVYLIRVSAWDRAGLTASAEQKVALRRTPPKISLDVEKKDRKLRLALANSVSTPLSFWWLRIYQDGGRIVKAAAGDHFPADVTVDLPEHAAGSKFELILVAQDVLGNRTRRKVKDLLALTAKAQMRQQENETESQWLEDF